jgi:hypothetical protein
MACPTGRCQRTCATARYAFQLAQSFSNLTESNREKKTFLLVKEAIGSTYTR